MKKLLLLALILIMVVSAIGCAVTPKKSTASPSASADAAQTMTGTYQKIKPDEVKKMMDNGDAIILVDVRTAEEYWSGNIQGAINIPVETIADKRPTELTGLNDTIIIYCRSGVRSAVAAKALIELGYTQVYDMGGIIDWPFDTVTASKTPPPAAQASSDGVLSTFTATDIDGNAIDATILSGYKLTMVNIWATFCSPCIEEMPDLGKLHSLYADKSFQVVGIVADAADRDGVLVKNLVELAEEIVDKTGADYLHILPSADINRLVLSQVAAVPTTIFVDANGNQIGEAYVGARSGDAWATIIDGLLSEAN